MSVGCSGQSRHAFLHGMHIHNGDSLSMLRYHITVHTSLHSTPDDLRARKTERLRRSSYRLPGRPSIRLIEEVHLRWRAHKRFAALPFLPQPRSEGVRRYCMLEGAVASLHG